MHGTRPAFSLAAPFLGPCEPESIAQRIEQTLGGIHGDGDGGAVEGEGDDERRMMSGECGIGTHDAYALHSAFSILPSIICIILSGVIGITHGSRPVADATAFAIAGAGP